MIVKIGALGDMLQNNLIELRGGKQKLLSGRGAKVCPRPSKSGNHHGFGSVVKVRDCCCRLPFRNLLTQSFCDEGKRYL